MENHNKKADEFSLTLNRKDKNTVVSVIFTLTMLLGLMVCCICDAAITGRLTWSLIPLSAIVFAWIVSIPLVLSGKRGVLGGILSFSIFIVPFLYILGILTTSMAVFRIGSVLSIPTLIYLWGIYVLYARLRNRKLLATGIAFILAIPFMLAVNMALSKMISEPIFGLWDTLSAALLLAAGVLLIFWDCARNKG